MSSKRGPPIWAAGHLGDSDSIDRTIKIQALAKRLLWGLHCFIYCVVRLIVISYTSNRSMQEWNKSHVTTQIFPLSSLNIPYDYIELSKNQFTFIFHRRPIYYMYVSVL